MSKRTESNFWKTLKSNIEKIDSEVVLTRIENSQTPGIPDLLLMDRNKRLHMIELKVAKGNQVNLSPFQVSFAVRHQGSNCWVLVQRWRPADTQPECLLYSADQVMDVSWNGMNKTTPRLHFPCLSGYSSLIEYLSQGPL
jgi:hypothetical protein